MPAEAGVDPGDVDASDPGYGVNEGVIDEEFLNLPHVTNFKLSLAHLGNCRTLKSAGHSFMSTPLRFSSTSSQPVAPACFGLSKGLEPNCFIKNGTPAAWH